MRVKAIRRAARFDVRGDGRGLVSRAGTGLVVGVAQHLDVERALRRACEGVRPRALHHPGTVLGDVAVMLADGGTRLRHVEVLRGQQRLFGTVASASTVTRTIAALADDVDVSVAALDVARAQVRAAAWSAGAEPACITAVRKNQGQAGPVCVDIDATLVTAHSDDKDRAGKTYKRTWGFHPMTAWLDRGDGTGEALAAELRPGNAGANNTKDQITIVDRALAQLPSLPDGTRLLMRGDTAAAVHGLTGHCRNLEIEFSVGWAFKDATRQIVHHLHTADQDVWVPARRQNGTVRTGAAVTEITGHDDLNLSGWPDGSRVIVRREPLHPGAQQTFDDVDGFRFTAFLTDQTAGDIAALDVIHRAHARVEDRIRCAKNTGLQAMPCDTFDRNQIYTQIVMLAADLLTFTQRLTLTGQHAIAEPKLLRYQLLHVAGHFTVSGRTRMLHLPDDWPYTPVLVAAFRRLRALPAPAPG